MITISLGALRAPLALVAAVAVLAGAFPMAETAAAEPQLDYSIKIALKENYEQRLRTETCEQYFRYYSMDVRNWLIKGDRAKAQVVFAVEYLGSKALYGVSDRSRRCLGRDAGEGFFQVNTSYQSAGFIYTLSRWSEGWHVDKVELQP